MRALLVLVALMLAGCSQQHPFAAQAPPQDLEAAPVAKRLTLVDAVVTWHEVGGTGTDSVLQAVNLATQVAVHPCVFDGTIYFNNHHLAAYRGKSVSGNGTLRATLSWTLADYTGDGLRIGYATPGNLSYSETGVIGNGATLDTQVQIVGAEIEGAPPWDLWLCIKDDTLDSVNIVPGSIDVFIEYIPDGLEA